MPDNQDNNNLDINDINKELEEVVSNLKKQEDEDLIVEKVEEVVQEEPTEEVEAKAELTEEEKEAISMGWNPDKSKLPAGKEFVSAGEFLRRKPFFEKIQSLSDQIKEMKGRLDNVNNKVKEAEKRGYQKAYQDIEKARNDAIENGDVAAVQKLDDEYFKVKQLAAVEEQQDDSNEIPDAYRNSPQFKEDMDEFVAFEKKHEEWARGETPEDRAMVAYTIEKVKELRGKDPTLPAKQLMTQVEESIMKLYPNRFRKQTQKFSPVSDTVSDKRASDHKSYDLSSLSETERMIYDQVVVNDKAMSREEFFTTIR